MEQEFVVGGIPFLIINTVENAHQFATAIEQHSLKATTEFRSRDFLSIPRADRGEKIGKSNSCFEAVHLAVKLNAFGIEIVPGEIGQKILVRRKHSLISEI